MRFNRLTSFLILLFFPLCAASASLDVFVRDATGTAVNGARVLLLDSQRATIAAGSTGGDGHARLEAANGAYLIRTEYPGFAPRSQAVQVTGNAASIEVTMEAKGVAEEVTISATPGVVRDVASTPQAVNVIGEEELRIRAKTVLAQVAEFEPGLHWQRTSPTISGIFVRGLTGAKVNVFVDGVRYSTAAMRGGISSFFNLNDANVLSGVEVLRGPSSAQYGSDALGGSIQLLSRIPSFAPVGQELSGSVSIAGGTADRSFGSSLGASWATTTSAFQVSLSGLRANSLRPGKGEDSHNAVTRFFGLPSSIAVGDRLPNTAFTQFGGSLKGVFALGTDLQLIASYTRGQQEGGQRYDQLIGGDGNLIADLKEMMLDFGYLKLDKRNLGFLDQATLTYSVNSQREERVNQGGNGNRNAAINHEYERTTAHGLQLSFLEQIGHHTISLGGDVTFEKIDAPSFGESATTGVVTVRRGRVPDDATYRQGGIFVQDTFQATDRLSLVGNLRWGGAAYESKASNSPIVGGATLWPDDSLHASALTFRLGGVYDVAGGLSLAASVGRGFRAPHITDLGTLGLTGAGFEANAADLAGRGARVGSTADANAVDLGQDVKQLEPETSLTYEGSIRFRKPAFDANLTVYVNDIKGNIAYQALILPQGAVGTQIGDQTITRQNPNGTVIVPLSSNPVLVRANFDDVRLWGLEYTANARLGSDFSASLVATYQHAEDKRTGLPPNIEGGTPNAEGWLRVRWAPAGKRFWVEPYLRVATDQTRLSSLDLGDRRTGASRSRTSIAAFFNNGARARGLVGNGADGQAGTADDVLIASGETLAQIQARVLGTASSSSLFTQVDGFTVVGLRGGVRLGEGLDALIDFENLTDTNYRGISWGVDAPGFGVYVRLTARF
ncbi:MAG: TonB-dependent receptor [Thermoanaerobaculia bacterium]